MTTWRLILVVGVAVMVGFVGGVWFIGSGVGFQWIKPPPVAPAAIATRRVESRPRPRAVQTKVEAVGVPEPVNIAGGWDGLGRLAERTDLMPSSGCTWEVEPREFRLDQEWHKSSANRLLIAVPSFEPTTGRLRYSLVQSTRSQDAVIALRLVLFDAAGHRFTARVTSQGSSGGTGGYVAYTRHDWDDVPVANQPSFAFVGVERVVPESARLVAEAARVLAREKGVTLLPPPRLGEPFEFDLPTVDGTRVRSSDLQGKAVLVVLTGPFPRWPVALNQIRKEIPADDLAVVAISFEATAEAARTILPTLGEPTSLVQVPNEAGVRQLWREGAEIHQLPAYWIVDPHGVLRFQEQGMELSDRLATVLGRPTRLGKFEAITQRQRELAGAKRPLPDSTIEPAQPIAKGNQ